MYLLTDVNVCSCPVAIQLGIHFFILAVHFNSFCVVVNGAFKVLLLELIVPLILVKLGTCCNAVNYHDLSQLFFRVFSSGGLLLRAFFYRHIQYCRHDTSLKIRFTTLTTRSCVPSTDRFVEWRTRLIVSPEYRFAKLSSSTSGQNCCRFDKIISFQRKNASH